MKKYLKYGWLVILVIVPVFLNFSKTEQDILTVVSSSTLDSVKNEVEKDPNLLSMVDEHGFTILDYAVLNENSDVQEWLFSQNIPSGVSKQMIERIRLWFLLLGIPVNSENFNLQGVYDKGLADAIINYQTTRGLAKSSQITPDWYAHLEEDGIRHLQEMLLGVDSPMVTGIWNAESADGLKAFQKTQNLPETGHLSIVDIVALMKAQEKVAPIIVTPDNAPSVTIVKKLPKFAAVEVTPPKVDETTMVEVMTEAEPTASPDDTENKMTSGFLIDGHATAGKMLNLQVWLTIAGFPAGTLDGQMGPESRQAIKDFESSIGLPPKGILSAKWEAPLETIIWKKVQEKLKQLKLYDQSIDGIPGSSTVEALKAYEKSVGVPPTGQLLPETLSLLFNEGQMMDDGSMDDLTITDVGHSEEDDIIEEESEEDSNVGSEASEENATTEEDTLLGLPGFNPKGTEEALNLQLMLTILGEFKEEVDGEMNPALIEAIKSFQSKQQLGVDGKVGRQTMAALNAQTITRIQRFLNEKGLLEDAPTGTLGPKTRKIITKLRQDYKLPDSDPTQLDIGILLIVLGEANDENYVKTYLELLEEKRLLKEKTQKVQEYLTALGYFNGKIDGIMGKSTTDAILKYKKAYKLPNNDQLTEGLMSSFKAETIKGIQLGLGRLGYKLKADGLMGPGTKKAIESFQKRYSHKVTGDANLETLHQVNGRLAANNRRSPTASSQVQSAQSAPKGVMPVMGARGAQAEKILTQPPQAIVGRMSMIYNSKGGLSGCKVNNISISAAMCEGAKNNQQCRIVYRKGRVLSVLCRG